MAYPLPLLVPKAPEAVEKVLAYPTNLVSWYDQGPYGACVGFSCSWQTSIYNTPKKYNGMWLYRAAREIAGLDPNQDDGAYLWAGQKVLQKKGHCIDKTTSPSLDEGVSSYYWCTTVDEVRSAIGINRPVVFGIYWYSGFNDPTTYNGEKWIGRSTWGSVLGGHAICCIGASDQRQAVLLLNTWGTEWNNGKPVWISYANIQKLMDKQGECTVGVDRGSAPPPPPPPPSDEIPIKVKIGNRKWVGEVHPK